MARNLNRTQTVAQAQADARRNVEAYALTHQELEALTWEERQTKAKGYARIASALTENVDPKYADVYEDEYTNAVQNRWNNVLKQHEQKRRAFRTALTGLSLEQAEEKVRALATSFNFRGARTDNHCLEIMRGDRDGATLYWRFDRTDHETVNPDNPMQRVQHYALRIELSTCGTTYSLARMALVHKIHGELLEAAAEIEATMASERVISTWGILAATEPQTVQA